MRRPFRGFAVYAAILLAVLVLAQIFSLMSTPISTTIKYAELLDMIEKDQVTAIAIMDNQVVGLAKGGKVATADFPTRYDFDVKVDRDNFFETVRLIRAQKTGTEATLIGDNNLGFTVDYLQQPARPWYLDFLPYLVLMILMVVFWMFIMRQQQGGNSKVMTFGRSRARAYDATKNKTTFADVAGADEEKEELREIVEFLKNPQKFIDIGARIPKGVLLVGPPGTGKTLLARAVAGEAGVPFYSISGSDFVEMFVGVGASRVRDLFEQAKKHTPSIVFIDEIDAVGRHRGAGMGGGHDEREQTLNQLLVEMDGFTNNEGVIVIAATNRRDILDPALLRPGRFDRQVTVNYPDVQGRIDILKVHSRGKPLADDVDLKVVARGTPMCTGADLENVMNEAAILTARAGQKQITMHFIEEAIKRVEMGPEKRSRKVSATDRRITAYHEAGHAIVGLHLPKAYPVHMVTIVPRGDSGGHTQYLPDEERSFITKELLLSQIASGLGGRAAEMVVLDDVTMGAVSDLQHATDSARRMVTQFGMSDAIGPVFVGNGQEVFLGRDFGQTRNVSEKTAAIIDEEVRRILEESLERALGLLREYRGQLDRLADLLLEQETVLRPELEAILADAPLPPKPEGGVKPEPPTDGGIIIAPELPMGIVPNDTDKA